MVETLGVLAIVGLLSMGGIKGYTVAMTRYKVSKTYEQVNVISSRISAVGDQVPSYEGLDNKTAVQLKAIPGETTVGDDATLRNLFGGEIIIESADLLGDDAGKDQAYVIKYTGISDEGCVQLAAQNWGGGKNNSLVGVGFANDEDKMAYLVTAITQNCAGAADEVSPDQNAEMTKNTLVACPGGATVGIPIPVDKAVGACSCGNENCVMVIKYF